jgi:TATA-binding protein-associated factor Taf7
MSEDKIPESSGDGPIELESQFILRLPLSTAAALRATVAAGVPLRDRLLIQVDADMRHGKVYFDGVPLPGKILDLPTIIESQKTLDKKTFYKTADICQIMVCKEEVEEEKVDADDGKRNREKEKKFQYAHGITAPLKNVRKKRFRKTLKKKNVDVPEIEKEVRRLFKQDSEAQHVRFEVVNADDDKADGKSGGGDASAMMNNNSHSMDIAEHELFGEIVSSSDEDDTRAPESNEDSRQSDSNRFPVQRDSLSTFDAGAGSSRQLITEFPKGILNQQSDLEEKSFSSFDMMAAESTNAAAAVAALEAMEEASTDRENEGLMQKLKELEQEIHELQSKRRAQEEDIAKIENPALRKRFETLISSFKEQEAEKQRQYDDLCNLIN